MSKRTLFVIMLFLSMIVTAISSELTRPFPQEVTRIFDTTDGLPDSLVNRIFLDKNTPVAVTENGFARFRNDQWERISDIRVPQKTPLSAQNLPVDSETILMVAMSENESALGTTQGLFLKSAQEKNWQRALPADQNYSWALRDVSIVIYDARGRLWFAAPQGIGFRENGQWHLFTGKEGLPWNEFTCAAAGADAEIWLGTTRGAIRCDGEKFQYRFSRRWLPHDFVNDIVVEPNGTAWIATNGGVSRIERRQMTLEEKAAYFTEQVESRHNRMGFVADCRLKERFNVDSWTPKISDNDGLYTAMYGSAQAFRFAATGESEAKKLATRSFQACKWLVDITHESGFPARVIIPVDWPEPVNEQYGPAYNARKRKGDPFWKMITPRFPLSKDGKYRWKCDTSSDELAGHYFFYGVYYGLVAKTEAEKRPVRKVVRAITDHLLRNDLHLRDHDGKSTRWGNFSPDFFRSVWAWEQRGLNSMMMLSFLNVAHHVTGDAKYRQAAQELCDKYQYHINALEPKMYFPPKNVVPWDNNLSLMSLYGLMRYETDPERMLIYRLGLEHAWLHISKQKNAFWNLLYGALTQHFREFVATGIYETGEVFPEAGPYAGFMVQRLLDSDPRMQDNLEFLRGIPLDLIGYEIDNTHRLDVIFDPTPGQKPTVGWHFDGRAVPIAERGHVRQDRDGFALYANEDGGWAEHEGTFFLLPYYLGRYHGFIK